MDIKRLIILNPKSKHGRAANKFTEMQPRLREMYGNYDLHITSGPNDAEQKVRHVLYKKKYNQILVAGGDGTVNEVVNGYFDKGRIIRKNIPLGVIDLGTGGDFYRMRSDLNPAYHVSVQKNIFRRIDCGLIRDKSAKELRYFVNIASLGIAPEVIYSIKNSIFQRGPAAYYFHSIKTLMKSRPQSFNIRLIEKDGRKIEIEEKLIQIFICNGQSNGGGMKWAPDADVQDGLFDVVLLSLSSRIKLILETGKVYSGKIREMSGVKQFKASEINIIPTHPQNLEMDGELIINRSGKIEEINYKMLSGVLPVIW